LEQPIGTRSGYGESEASSLIQMNETWSNFSRSASGRRRAGKPREEANEVALSSGPGFGENAREMAAHRRDSASSLRRRLANAQSAQQVGGQDRLRRRQIECPDEDGRIRHGVGERVRDLENNGRSPDIGAERTGSGRDGHEDEVRLAGWAAQVQRAGDPWSTARAGGAGEKRPKPRGKSGC
jgi:hypothetical protein